MSGNSWFAHRIRAGARRHRVVRNTAPDDEESPPSAIRGHLIVCGDEPLAHRVVEELVTRYRRSVTVILPSRRRNHGPQIARLPGVRIVESEQLNAEALRLARVSGADAVAIVRQDDVGNIHAALQVQELNPRAHLVIRMFNLSLGYGIRSLFADCTVLSDAAMAAPAFVAAAVGDLAPVHVRVPGRALFVAAREAVPAERVVCTLATTLGDRTALLPRDPGVGDLVLAVAERDPLGDRVERRRRRVRHWLRQWVNPLRAVQLLLVRKLALIAVLLVLILIIGTGILAKVDHVTWWDAAYVTVLTALGGANPDLTASRIEKITQTVLTVVSIALIPVVTGAVVEAVVNARLAIALGRLHEPVSDHVIVVGLGNVGTRVIRELHARGVPVVAIDRTETARGIQLARELRVPVIIGDASREETLRAASVQTCRALVVLSTDDVVNLEAAVHGRVLRPGLRVVLRLFDGDFADRVERAFRIDVSRSVSYLAGPAFAAAMLRREVIGVIPVNRRVLLIAELVVGAGSTMDAELVSFVQAMDGVRVIAVRSAGRLYWSPPADRQIAAADVLLVIATRDGLGRAVAATV